MSDVKLDPGKGKWIETRKLENNENTIFLKMLQKLCDISVNYFLRNYNLGLLYCQDKVQVSLTHYTFQVPHI